MGGARYCCTAKIFFVMVRLFHIMFCADGKWVEQREGKRVVRRRWPPPHCDLSEAVDEDPVAMYTPRSRPVKREG